MNFLKLTRLEPGKVASFHVKDSLTPEEEVFALFQKWAQGQGLLETHRFIPVLGFNHPWGEEGKPRGYEIWCFLDGLGEVDISGVTVKAFPGGLFAVTTIPGLHVLPKFAHQLRQAIEAHPRYEADYPKGYRLGVDPSPELEMVYTPGARKFEDFVLDYFIPIKEIAP
ncbi:MAG: GyrI-like domain-containing protein [Planctomycetota bacterium]|jgi:hypothetical protein